MILAVCQVEKKDIEKDLQLITSALDSRNVVLGATAPQRLEHYRAERDGATRMGTGRSGGGAGSAETTEELSDKAANVHDEVVKRQSLTKTAEPTERAVVEDPL
eukprot:CAMPEP_0198729838 /NCGR_PEP_ID=MMETSP1475-20131203/21250_1 /TAXON_ID= ORGANISM="Unidentified sp., Strain CCMP1999" /NCGR_SAMPLE_ID=MMETSP1475 /ASSEMBLY_ACC=CAM_ASM_001111 /LENGTH=103 /DNA_ID=CAMNT_0044492551 /DNA_START=48 /DNA_END=355 /DNA_ORIENTATION=+